MTEEVPESDAPKSDPPTHRRGKLLIEKLNAYRNIILAVAALATAVGSWFRPTDTTATKNSFDWTSKKIEELSDNQVKTKQDMVALRNYVEGYVKGQAASAAADDAADVAAGAAPRHAKKAVRRPHTPPLAFGGALGEQTTPATGAAAPAEGAPNIAFDSAAADVAEAAPEMAVMPLPELQANPIPIKKPSFEKIAESAH
jgi:hypothetical protein